MLRTVSLQSLIYRNFFSSALMPILIIEVALLLLYFGINRFFSEHSQLTLLGEVTQNLEQISAQEVSLVDQQLQQISRTAQILQRDHQAFFARLHSGQGCLQPNGPSQFTTHANGAYFKPTDNGGATLYYSSSTVIGEREQRKARCSEVLDPLLISLVETSPLITQAYLNTWDDMNRLYPFMPDAPSQYGPVLNVEQYNFYFLANTEHNPRREPVWTGAYLDPAGQGWMISNIVPIYRGDFLEGVSGLDVTIDSFVRHLLDLELPWEASAFMVDADGMILGMPESVEQILQLRELKQHVYSENIQSTIEKPEEYNLLQHPDPGLQSQMQLLFDSQATIGELKIGDTEYLLSQAIVPATGWRLMTLVDKARVFSPVYQLKQLSDLIGYFAIGIMVLFYVVFFVYLRRKSRMLASKLAQPIEQLAELSGDIGANMPVAQLPRIGIEELDHLSHNFNQMTSELNNRTHDLVESQLREKVKEKETELLEQLSVTDGLTDLYNRRKLDIVLKQELERTKRFLHPFGMILIDIDHFKSVNDTFGHQVGDMLLTDIGRVLKTHTRNTDIVGRWGGEEFMVISPETDQQGLLNLAENLRLAIEQQEFPVVKHKTASFGVAVYQSGDEIIDLVAKVDKALYEAKSNGRNQVRCLMPLPSTD